MPLYLCRWHRFWVLVSRCPLFLVFIWFGCHVVAWFALFCYVQSICLCSAGSSANFLCVRDWCGSRRCCMSASVFFFSISISLFSSVHVCVSIAADLLCLCGSNLSVYSCSVCLRWITTKWFSIFRMNHCQMDGSALPSQRFMYLHQCLLVCWFLSVCLCQL